MIWVYKFQNYHRHSMLTNPRISDSIVRNEDYAKRAVELGHGIISTMEHGWQGRYIEGYELAQKYGLKFVFGSEAYWVKDRLVSDRSNCHIYLGARNEEGRRAINDILAEANVSGFYGQPRVDILLLLSLPANDVIVTSACLAFWKYEDADQIVLRLREHFGGNFFLEVQAHNTEPQRRINDRILELSQKYAMPLIMGCDSHYIHWKDAEDRREYLVAKEMDYADEDGWLLDYPDGDEAYRRFAKQCVLGHAEIREAMENTHVFLEVEEYDCPCFNKEIKMTTLYPGLSQEERDAKYDEMIWSAWQEERKNIEPDKWALYEREIQKEMDIVHQTKHADYFLVGHEIVKTGKEMGGVITQTGRGSSVSFITNKLAGLTDVDRIAAKVHMYPERFMSPTRIMETKSLADIDYNLGTPEIFAKAQAVVLGENHSAPMVAYGTLKESAAWKMYAKAQEVDFETANRVSEQIKRYEKAKKHADEDETDSIDPFDYIDNQYHEIYAKSEEYRGIIVSWSPHPCAYLIYQGDIRREIGLVRIKDAICCVMDGKWAEDYRFLKNDLLKVSVAELIATTFKEAKTEILPVNELLRICMPDSPVWKIYQNGCTLGVNQVEKTGTTQRVMKYKPTNISELCAFVAAIRPGFASMYKTFEKREHFEYGIKSLDKLIQTEEMPHSFILYQEMSMAVLNYAGIPMSECYEIIKNIAKKRVEKVLRYKRQFIDGFTATLINEEGQTAEQAKEISDQVWRILEDSSRYAFNSAHSYCVAIDSLYCAYLKTYYPLHFYKVLLIILEAKGNKGKMAEVKAEAESYFNIRFPPYKYGQDNRTIAVDVEHNAITNSMTAIKGFGRAIGEAFYQCGLYELDNFMDLLQVLDHYSIKSSKVVPLIKIDYFSRYGNNRELLRLVDMFDDLKQGTAKSIKRDKITGSIFEEIIQPYVNGQKKDGTEAKAYRILDMQGLLRCYEQHIRSLGLNELETAVKIANQLAVLGYVHFATGRACDRRKLVVLDHYPLLDKDTGVPWGYAIKTQSIGTGKRSRLTIKADKFEKTPLKQYDVVYATEVWKNKQG